MDKLDWHKSYMDRIKERCGAECTDDFAQEVLDAGIDDIDYEDDPIDAADVELSYWSD
jgi:hypothetical protein